MGLHYTYYHNNTREYVGLCETIQYTILHNNKWYYIGLHETKWDYVGLYYGVILDYAGLQFTGDLRHQSIEDKYILNYFYCVAKFIDRQVTSRYTNQDTNVVSQESPMLDPTKFIAMLIYMEIKYGISGTGILGPTVQ